MIGKREGARMVALVAAARGRRLEAAERSQLSGWLLRVMGKRASRSVMPVSNRELVSSLRAAGIVADGVLTWCPAERVLQWRRVGRRQEALVRWRGFDAVTGREHEDSWVPRGRLSKGLLQRAGAATGPSGAGAGGGACFRRAEEQ